MSNETKTNNVEATEIETTQDNAPKTLRELVQSSKSYNRSVTIDNIQTQTKSKKDEVRQILRDDIYDMMAAGSLDAILVRTSEVSPTYTPKTDALGDKLPMSADDRIADIDARFVDLYQPKYSSLLLDKDGNPKDDREKAFNNELKIAVKANVERMTGLGGKQLKHAFNAICVDNKFGFKNPPTAKAYKSKYSNDQVAKVFSSWIR